MKISLLVILFPALCFASGPKYVGSHTDPQVYQEFQNVYHDVPNRNTTPTIYIGAGAPSISSQIVGDIYVSTTTSKVYISTAAASSSGWAVLN
jgi:hypothetical protein